MDTYFSSVVSEGKCFVLKHVSERETRSRFRKEMGCGAACREHLDAGERWSENRKNKTGTKQGQNLWAGEAGGRRGKHNGRQDQIQAFFTEEGPSPTPVKPLLNVRALHRKTVPCMYQCSGKHGLWVLAHVTGSSLLLVTGAPKGFFVYYLVLFLLFFRWCRWEWTYLGKFHRFYFLVTHAELAVQTWNGDSIY